MVKGSYSLVIQVKRPFGIETSSTGKIEIEKGFYVYNGSAFGPGGFKRIDRHLDLSKGDSDYSVHWHIDHLTSRPETRITGVLKAPEVDIEDDLSLETDLKSVPGFGASDSDVDTHLLYSDSREKALDELEASYETLAENYSFEKVD